jgi:hypothetical protein
VKQVAQMDKEINFDTVNKERDSLIADLSKNLSEEELARLLFKSTEFKNKRIGAHDFHNYLLQLPYSNIKTHYPALFKYIEYLNLHANIDVIDLFDEIDRIEDAVKEEYVKNNDERQISKLARNVQIMSGYFALELIPTQYAYFKAHPEEFRILEWQSFLDRLARGKGLSRTVPQDVSLIQDKMATVDNFYILAKQRDGIFLEKIKKYITQENADVCALVTGGFHSTNLAKMFYDAGYSFMTVLPVVTEVTDEKLYHSVLKYKTDLMKKSQKNQ